MPCSSSSRVVNLNVHNTLTEHNTEFLSTFPFEVMGSSANTMAGKLKLILQTQVNYLAFLIFTEPRVYPGSFLLFSHPEHAICAKNATSVLKIPKELDRIPHIHTFNIGGKPMGKTHCLPRVT